MRGRDKTNMKIMILSWGFSSITFLIKYLFLLDANSHWIISYFPFFLRVFFSFFTKKHICIYRSHILDAITIVRVHISILVQMGFKHCLNGHAGER